MVPFGLTPLLSLGLWSSSGFREMSNPPHGPGSVGDGFPAGSCSVKQGELRGLTGDLVLPFPGEPVRTWVRRWLGWDRAPVAGLGVRVTAFPPLGTSAGLG